MTAQKIIDKSAKLLGYQSPSDSRIQAVAINALNRIYAELFFLENRENFAEITNLSQEINLKERILFDVMPYGVASVMASSLGDTENANYMAEIYNKKRKRQEYSFLTDAFPNVEG